jgi:pantoate--beta-alanine ligase
MTRSASSIDAVREAVGSERRQGASIGLVPTMGALHEGHASLIRAARAETGFTVVSIFVNPAQFGPNEDFTRYPRPMEKDVEICRAEAVDLVFVPDVQTIYPADFGTFVEVQQLQEVLEGVSRPGHFRGVTTVVLKLFNIVQPDIAYFGQKDAQQARVIQQMVNDLNLPIKLRTCPIVRESDGLALSSRNQYLNPEERKQATVLYQVLQEARELIEAGQQDAVSLKLRLESRIQSTPRAVVDYVALVNPDSFEPVHDLTGDVLIALAVRFGRTRLIDNLLLPERERPRDRP